MSDDIAQQMRDRIAALDEQIGPLAAERRKFVDALAGYEGQGYIRMRYPRSGVTEAAENWVSLQAEPFRVADLVRAVDIGDGNASAYLRRIGAVRVSRGVYRRPEGTKP